MYIMWMIGFIIIIVFYGKKVYFVSLLIKSIGCVCCCNDNLYGGIFDWIC